MAPSAIVLCCTCPMETRTRRRIDAFWTRVFSPTDAPAELVIVEHRSAGLIGYPGIYCVVRAGTVFISAPGDLVDRLYHWRPSGGTVTDPTWWSQRLATWSVLGPSIHAFTDAGAPIDSKGSELLIRAAAPAALANLRGAVSPAEWGESGFAGHDVALAWCVTDDHGGTVAASNLTPFDGVPADVGVLTSPRCRGRGAGAAVAAAAVRHAIEQFGIARWRALTTNAASLRLAEKLGFQHDCVQLAVRPIDPRST